MFPSRQRIKLIEIRKNYCLLTLILNEVKSKYTKDDYLETKCNDRNQKDYKIAWRLGGGFLSFPLSFYLLIQFSSFLVKWTNFLYCSFYEYKIYALNYQNLLFHEFFVGNINIKVP